MKELEKIKAILSKLSPQQQYDLLPEIKQYIAEGLEREQISARELANMRQQQMEKLNPTN